MTMTQQVVFTGVGQIELQERELPAVDSDDLLLKVRRVGICATDLHILEGYIGDPFPLVPGHEFVGEVARIGEGAKAKRGLSIGDHVAVEMLVPCGTCEWCQRGEYNVCADDDVVHGGAGRQYGINISQSRSPGLWGGYAQYLFVPAEALTHPIDPSVSWDAAALVEPLAVASRCVLRGRVGLGDDVAVIGPGPVGVLASAAAKEAGAGRVVVIGTRQSRLDVALRFGADATVNSHDSDDTVASIRETLGGRLPDVVIETAGVPAAQSEAVRLVRRSGRVVLAGAIGSHVPVTFYQDEDLLLRDVEVIASFLSAGGYAPAVDALERGRYPFAELVTHTFSLQDVAQAFEVVAHKKDEAMKVVLAPSG